MKAQPPSLQVGLYAPPPFLKAFGIVMEQGEIIHVSNIAFGSKNFLAVMIQAIEIQVGEELGW